MSRKINQVWPLGRCQMWRGLAVKVEQVSGEGGPVRRGKLGFSLWPLHSRKQSRPPWATSGCWEQNSGLLQEQDVLLSWAKSHRTWPCDLCLWFSLCVYYIYWLPPLPVSSVSEFESIPPPAPVLLTRLRRVLVTFEGSDGMSAFSLLFIDFLFYLQSYKFIYLWECIEIY